MHRRRPFGRASRASPGANGRASSASKEYCSSERKGLITSYCEFIRSPPTSLSVWHFSQEFDAGRPTTYSPCANRRCSRPLRSRRPSNRPQPAQRHSQSSSCRRLMTTHRSEPAEVTGEFDACRSSELRCSRVGFSVDQGVAILNTVCRHHSISIAHDGPEAEFEPLDVAADEQRHLGTYCQT